MNFNILRNSKIFSFCTGKTSIPMKVYTRNISFGQKNINSKFQKVISNGRGLIKSITIVYFGSIALFGTGLYTLNYYIDSHEKIPIFGMNSDKITALSFSIDQRMLLKTALMYELVNKNIPAADEHFMVFLRHLCKTEGYKVDRDNDLLVEFIPAEKIKEKGPGFYNTYVDIVVRTAILKGQLGKLDSAKELLEHAKDVIDLWENDKNISLPGNPFLLSKGYRLLAHIYGIKGDTKNSLVIQNLYEKSIILCFEADPKKFVKLGINLFDDMLYLNHEKLFKRETYDAIMDYVYYLAKLNDKNSLKKAFSITLNNIILLSQSDFSKEMYMNIAGYLDRYFENSNPNIKFSIKKSDLPLLKLHLGEILWASKERITAISWAKEAFIESHNYSRQDRDSAITAKLAIDTLIQMYEIENKNGRFNTKIQNCKEVADEIYIPTYSSGAHMIWDSFK